MREYAEYIVKLRYGMEIGYGQELVRCKDCAKSVDPCGGWDRRCQVYGVVRDDFFCADGECKKSR